MEMATELLLSFLLRFHSVLPSVVEPAVAGDKSSSSATDEKTGSEADTEAPSESEPENDDNDEDPPGEPGEAQVGSILTAAVIILVQAFANSWDEFFSTSVCRSYQMRKSLRGREEEKAAQRVNWKRFLLVLRSPRWFP